MKSAVPNTKPIATLIVDGKLICLPAARLGDLFDDLIGRELNEKEFLKGRSYLFEDLSPQFNNLYSHISTQADATAPSGTLHHNVV